MNKFFTLNFADFISLTETVTKLITKLNLSPSDLQKCGIRFSSGADSRGHLTVDFSFPPSVRCDASILNSILK